MGGQAREMEELRLRVCRPVCPLCVCACVCVCVCLGALWAVLVAMRLEGRGAWTPWPAPSRGGERWRASVTWALMGKQLR